MPLLKSGLPLLKSAIKPLGLLGLTSASSAIDADIQKKISSGSGVTLKISADEMKDILEIIKSLEDNGLLVKGITETIENEAKEQCGGFLSLLLRTLGASLLGNLLTKRRGRGFLRAGEGSKKV